jgi:hypothetical protein
MNESLLTVTTRQVAVGQGGLMHCKILERPTARTIEIVFDCGSFNRDALREGIDDIEADSLDILFVSHLDSDHVNGIDYLMNKKEVETVVIPFLDELETVAMVCRSLSRGGITTDFLRFVGDPIGWFTERGAQRVITVGRPGLDDEGGGGGGPEPERPLGEPYWHHLEPRRDRTPRCIPHSVISYGRAPTLEYEGKEAIEVIATPPQAEITLNLGPPAAVASWTLVPYVHPFDAAAIGRFQSAVKRAVGVNPRESVATTSFRKRFLSKLVDRNLRKELKACYAALSTEHNDVSMSLYSGPIPWAARQSWSYVTHPDEEGPQMRLDGWARGGPAWICTGDANLRSAKTRDAWLRRYSAYFQDLGVFVLPHHGSHYNLSKEVLQRLGRVTYLACAKSASVHHPSAQCIGYLQQKGFGLWQVSEDPSSTFEVSIAIS